VYESGRLDDGRVYLVTQWTEGPTLEALLKQVSILKLPDALRILRAISGALAVAHDAGIIHRDIKPSNIIIPRGRLPDDLRYDEAQLIDFGAFGKLLEQKNVTETGQLFGTPLYMSPEQIRATPQSPASDIYSLGVLLYTMLLGDSPFRRQNFLESITAVAYEEVTIPSTIDLPPDVRAFLQKCLQKDPRQRPQSGSEALRIIQTLLGPQHAGTLPAEEGEEKGVPTRPEIQESFSWWKRYRKIILIVAIIAIGVYVLLLLQLQVSAAPSAPLQLSGIALGIVLAVGGVVIGARLRKWLAKRKTEIEKDSSQVLFRTKSRDVLSESISMQVDELIARCSAIDEKILGLTIMQMLKEYELAKESNQRQTALLNTIQLLEKLMNRLSPWYVRHDKFVAFLVSATGILSGMIAAATSLVKLFR